MFNLTVSEAHTFYVGTQGWLVHNGKDFGFKLQGRGGGWTPNDLASKGFHIGSSYGELRVTPVMENGMLRLEVSPLRPGTKLPSGISDALTGFLLDNREKVISTIDAGLGTRLESGAMTGLRGEIARGGFTGTAERNAIQSVDQLSQIAGALRGKVQFAGFDLPCRLRGPL